MGSAAAWGGWCASVCSVILGVLGWIGSLWISLVGGRVVQLVYPPLEVGQEYALGTVEVPGREVAGKSPLEILGGYSLGAVWVFCGGVEYGVISCWGIGRKMSWMRVRYSKRSVCRLAVASMMAHNRGRMVRERVRCDTG